MTTIIWDFDYTLLDSAKLMGVIRQAVSDCGVSAEDFNQTYQETVGREGYYYDYSPDYHFYLLGQCTEDQQCVQNARREFDRIITESCDFLYPGVIELLERLKSSSIRQILLTLGNQEYQGAKVQRCGLNEIFDEIHYVDNNKDKWLASFKTGGEVIVINDNGNEVLAMKKVCPEYRYILVKGPKDVPSELDIMPVEGVDNIEKAIGLT